MASENSDEQLDCEGTQELQNLIEKLGYRNSMDAEHVLNYPEENAVAEMLTDEEIIESVIGTDEEDEDEDEDESSTIEPPSRNEALTAAITLNNFLLSYEKTTPEVLTMIRKIRDELQAMENEGQYMWLSTSCEKYKDGGMDKEKQMEWQELHAALLNLILANLPFPGYIRFASVCSRWRQVQRNRLVRPPQSQHPILIQRDVVIAETYTIIGHSGVSREINLPGTFMMFVFASAYGWLLYGHGNNYEYFLLNPITNSRINLPAQLPQGAGWFSPVAISADPSTTEPENVIVMFMVDNAMVFCRAGDSEWSIIHTGEPYTVRGIWKSDMVACNGKVYALTETAKFGCVNFSSSCPEVDWLIQDDGFGLGEWGKDCVCRFLVESLGDVLMVLAFKDSSFEVYKADLNGMRWIAVSDLGDQVLFLGRGSSLAASTAEAGKSGIHISFPIDYLKLGGMEMCPPTMLIPQNVSTWKYPIYRYHWHWILPSL